MAKYSAATQAALFFARQNHRANAVVDTLKQAASGLTVSVGNYVKNKGNTYQALNSGTSGGTLPTHTLGVVSDGVIKWQYIHPKALVRVPNPTAPH